MGASPATRKDAVPAFDSTALDQTRYRRLSGDLQTALEGFSPTQRASLVTSCAAAAIRETAANKVDVGKTLVRNAPRIAAKSVSFAAGVGGWVAGRTRRPLPTASEAVCSAGTALKAGALRSARAVASLRRLSPQDLTQFLMTWIVAFASAGGPDLEGGLPDTDLLLGIQNHRNLFSHTILLGMAVETAMRFAYLLLEALVARMPRDRAATWSPALGYARAARSGSILGVWLGIGAHFIKDTGLIAGGFKPYTGIRGQSMEFHQALMTANGIAATTIGMNGESS